MNIFGISSIWKHPSGVISQRLGLSIAPSIEAAKNGHIEEVKKFYEGQEMVACDAIEATPAFIEALYQYVPNTQKQD